tara:strand:- start:590 stop:1063 length:474 start_codon:yes stop_codon:yes gene_type:complete
MIIPVNRLRKIIREEIEEAIDTHLSKAKSKMHLKDARPFEKSAFTRARRRHDRVATAAGEQEWLEGPIDSSTIGDIVPIGKDAWDRMSKIPGKDGIPSERDIYLSSLAYDIADGDVDMDDIDIERLEKYSKWFRDTYDSASLQVTADLARWQWEDRS